jgi:peptidoglycan L-alanyl-D-glutamate endopeptidase CwlK
MPNFGEKSNARLDTCHDNLQIVMREVVKHFDCSVIFGHRTREVQAGLYAQGRTMPGRIVTNCDGVVKLSKHQGVDGEAPSHAVDVVPYPIDWNDEERMVYFAGFVKGVAVRMGVKIRWGGDWDSDTETKDTNFRDLPHFELRT